MMSMNSARSASMETTADQQSVTLLNALLRGEISAAETYRLAIDHVAGDSTANAGVLREIQEEHGRTAQAVRDRIRELGGQAVDSSGAWGAWAKTIQATMNLFGDASSIKALKEGEEHGLKDYNDAITSLDAGSREMVQNQLIPQQQRHIDLLDQIIQTVNQG